MNEDKKKYDIKLSDGTEVTFDLSGVTFGEFSDMMSTLKDKEIIKFVAKTTNFDEKEIKNMQVNDMMLLFESLKVACRSPFRDKR